VVVFTSVSSLEFNFNDRISGELKPGEALNLYKECTRVKVNKYDSALYYLYEDFPEGAHIGNLKEFLKPIDGKLWTSKQVEDIILFVFSYACFEMIENYRKEIFRESSFIQWLNKYNGTTFNFEGLYKTIEGKRYYHCETDEQIDTLRHAIERWMSW
jgi:hypothetical protein